MIKELLLSTSIQFLCLTEALYHEARSEGYHEMVKVGVVIHNRVLDDNFPDDYCSVVDQPYQFSYRNGRISRSPMHNEEAKLNAAMAAYSVYTLDDRPYLENILYFHGAHIRPRWDFSKLRWLPALDSTHRFYANAR